MNTVNHHTFLHPSQDSKLEFVLVNSDTEEQAKYLNT